MLLLCLFFSQGLGCVAERETARLVIQEGPRMVKGRMSASLGVVRLADGRLVVIGGSPEEDPFSPIKGMEAIEILDPQRGVWEVAGIDIPYQLSGRAFLLPDGRVFVFGSVYVFDPSSEEFEPGRDKADAAGAVSAMIIDINKKTALPFYRPKGNDPNQRALQGEGPAFVQRAFAQELQLYNGDIVRMGGVVRYSFANPTPTCEKNRCLYCSRGACKPHPTENLRDLYCAEPSNCPSVRGDRQIVELSVIEVYTPPNAAHPMGRLRTFAMPDARQRFSAIQLRDGRIFVSGGRISLDPAHPDVYETTYFLDSNSWKATPGPRMRTPREDHMATLLEDGRVLLTGGTAGGTITVNSAEILNPATGLFYDARPMNEAREDHQPARLGDWIVLFGGEDNKLEDLIRNSAEIYSYKTGEYIGSFLLFRRDEIYDDDRCPDSQGYAGIDDFAAINLDERRVLILGGQQGCQDAQGNYLTAGVGNRRTLLISLPERR
jgi:hypothetical protein